MSLAGNVTDNVTKFFMTPYKGFLITPKTGNNVLHAIDYDTSTVTKLATNQIYETYGFGPPFKKQGLQNQWNLGDGVNRGEVLNSYKKLPPDFLTVNNPYSLRESNLTISSGSIIDTDLIYTENQSFIIALNSFYKPFVNLSFTKDINTNQYKPKIRYTTEKKWLKQKPQAGNISWSNGDTDNEVSFQYYSRLGKYVNLGTIYYENSRPINDSGVIDFSNVVFEPNDNVKALVTSGDPVTDLQQKGLYSVREAGEWKTTTVTKGGLLWSDIDESVCGIGVVKDDKDIEWLVIMTRPLVTEVKFYAKKIRGHSKNTDKFDEAVFLTLVQQYKSSQNPDTKKIIAGNIQEEVSKWREIGKLDFQTLIPSEHYLFSQISFPEFSFSQDGKKAVGIVSHVAKVIFQHRYSLSDSSPDIIPVPDTDSNANLSSVIELSLDLTSQKENIEEGWNEYIPSLNISILTNKPCLQERVITSTNGGLHTEKNITCILAVDYKDGIYREVKGKINYIVDTTINSSGSGVIDETRHDDITKNYRIFMPDGSVLKYDETETVDSTKKSYFSPFIEDPFTNHSVGTRTYEMLESIDLTTDSYIVRKVKEDWDATSERLDYEIDSNSQYRYTGSSSYSIGWENSVSVFSNSSLVYSNSPNRKEKTDQHSFSYVLDHEGFGEHYFVKHYFMPKERLFPLKEVTLQNPYSDPATLQLIPGVYSMVGFFANDDIAGNNGRGQQGVSTLPSGNFVASVYEGNYFPGQIRRDILNKERNPLSRDTIYLTDDIQWTHLSGNVNDASVFDLSYSDYLGLLPNPKATIFPISYIGE